MTRQAGSHFDYVAATRPSYKLLWTLQKFFLIYSFKVVIHTFTSVVDYQENCELHGEWDIDAGNYGFEPQIMHYSCKLIDVA